MQRPEPSPLRSTPSARDPQVSVVIPTRNRPELVVRAVRSALAQSLRDIEVIVVIDGPDPATAEALRAVGDERVRSIELEVSGGAPAARNHGVAAAHADWVAFLDDDDEWLPEKLATQLARAKASGIPLPIVGSRLFMRTPRAELIMPRRIPAPGEPISEYLAVRHGFFHGDGFIQTSTIMAPTALLRKVPFADGLRRLQELDWTLRSLQEEGVDLIYAEEPLVIWYADENRPRISFDAPWKQSLEWLHQTRPRVTPRAYAALAMSVVGAMAAASRSPRVFFDLLREARKHGKPGFTDYVTFLQVWLVPAGPRRVVRDFFLSRQRNKTQAQAQ
ncbi:glycosyltransferase family 2 protein [Dactylosporangium roseum]|uniref:glycosyltransferase family 2 protein n=1 Tax=Dactylosporangium roseum TaxID=47989 RepID=UPI0031D0D6AA